MIMLAILLVTAVLAGASEKFGVESRPGFAGAVDINSRLS
jgi:hypothetical protein